MSKPWKLPDEIVREIDWGLLKEQKKNLTNFFITQANVIPDSTLEAFDGIINLIEALQDCAVDYLGIDEKTVFDISND